MPRTKKSPEQRQASQKAAKQKFVEQIVSIMQQGKRPWVKPWDAAIPYMNPSTNQPYKGKNPFRLTVSCLYNGYQNPLFMGKGQASQLGWKIRKGSSATWIAQPIIVPDRNSPKEDATKLLVKWVMVFNLECFEPIDPDECDRTPEDMIRDSYPSPGEKQERIDTAERFIKAQDITPQYLGDRACYYPTSDQIAMPPFEAFKSPEHFYATEIHEHAHSTGHVNRLNRESLTSSAKFGSEVYAYEELIAELASSYVCEQIGIGPNLQHHADYLNCWLSTLQDDWSKFYKAYDQAIAAAHYLLEKAGYSNSFAESTEKVSV